MKATRGQFNHLVRDLVGPFNEAHSTVYDVIEAAYGGPRRRYHTLEHIGAGLKHLDDMAAEDKTRGSKFYARGWDLIRFAWWFHDYVNDGDPSDEERSATQALEVGLDLGLSTAELVRVANLINATGHRRIPLMHEWAIICDVDLSILGAEPDVFDNYEGLIRQEWAHIPDDLFAAARYVIMKRFAERPWIYMTEYGRTRWQRQAMSNLATSLATLSDQPEK